MEFTLISHLVSYVRQLGCLNDQGGKASQRSDGDSNQGLATFPIRFNKVLTVLGTLHTDGSSDSKHNLDDTVRFTTSKVTFDHFSHYYIAFGI